VMALQLHLVRQDERPHALTLFPNVLHQHYSSLSQETFYGKSFLKVI